MSRKSTKIRIHKKFRISWNKNLIIKVYWFSKFLKCLLKRGELDSISNSLLKGTALLKSETILPFFLFFESFEKSKPSVILGLCRKGPFFYRVPFGVKSYKLCRLGIKWLSMAINSQKYNSKIKVFEVIVKELKALLIKNSGFVAKKLYLSFEISLENRAKTHFRWPSSYNI